VKDKSTIRYIGHQALLGGGREYRFSIEISAEPPSLVTVEAATELFSGPGQIALQEGAAICFEMLRSRIAMSEATLSHRFILNPEDVAEHRKTRKGARQH